MKKFFFIILIILFFSVSSSGTILEIQFEPTTVTDSNGSFFSNQLQWAFDSKELNLSLNLESADLAKEYLVDFGLHDTFVFDGKFPNQSYLFHAFASTDEQLKVSELSGQCNFSLVGNLFGATNYSRLVLKGGSLPISVLKDESVFLLVDADNFEVCRLRLESQTGDKTLNLTVNFKLVPSAYQILVPLLRTCKEAPADKCFQSGALEWNYSDLVERQGCAAEIFLGGVEIEGGPPKACDEAEKVKLRNELTKKDASIVELQAKQVPEAVEAINKNTDALVKTASDVNSLQKKIREQDDTLGLVLAVPFIVFGVLYGYNRFKRPTRQTYSPFLGQKIVSNKLGGGGMEAVQVKPSIGEKLVGGLNKLKEGFSKEKVVVKVNGKSVFEQQGVQEKTQEQELMQIVPGSNELYKGMSSVAINVVEQVNSEFESQDFVPRGRFDRIPSLDEGFEPDEELPFEEEEEVDWDRCVDDLDSLGLFAKEPVVEPKLEVKK